VFGSAALSDDFDPTRSDADFAGSTGRLKSRKAGAAAGLPDLLGVIFVFHGGKGSAAGRGWLRSDLRTNGEQ